ncbi:MAG: zinc ribbon domain-containing protein [Gemmatimonadaceae bacterium]
MHQDVVILLDVQQDDAVIFELEDAIAALAPRMAALEAGARRAEESLAEGAGNLGAEEKRQRDLQFRIDQHRDLLKRHEEVLNTVTSPREAAAAVAQTEQARRMLADDEREMASIHSRVDDLRKYVGEREREVETTRAAQSEARESVAADQKALQAKLDAAQRARREKAGQVPRGLLARYDRIQRRQRSVALFALRGQSCGNCDTMIPMQRRNVMAGTGAPEVCEGCGVLLYSAAE